jgi:ubiquinol-cytochrome c reductase cytochrome b subunit
VDYLKDLWAAFSGSGYCSNLEPEVQTRLGDKGQTRYLYRFKTWTFSSFNFYRDFFYVEANPLTGEKARQIIPHNIEEYLTPLVLAAWIMDDGTASSYGLRLCTHCFSLEDHQILIKALHSRYGF